MVLVKGSKGRQRYKTEKDKLRGKGVMMLISRTLNWRIGSIWGFLRWPKEAEWDRDTQPYLPVLSTKLWSVTSITPGTCKVGQAMPEVWKTFLLSLDHNCLLGDLQLCYVMGWIVSLSHKSHMLKPSSLSAVPQKVAAFGNRAYKDILTKMGPLQCVLIQSDWCPYKRRLRYTEGWPREEAAGRWSSTNQGERCQRKSTLQIPRPWTSSLQNCEKINFCCLGDPVCGILLYSSLTRSIFILQALSTFPVLNHHFFLSGLIFFNIICDLSNTS